VFHIKIFSVLSKIAGYHQLLQIFYLQGLTVNFPLKLDV